MTTAVNTAQILALLAQRQAQTSNKKTVKVPSGNSRWRLLPGWRKSGDPLFYHDFGRHFVKDAAGQVKAVAVCLDKTFGKPCQACTMLSQAIHMTTDDLTKKRLEDMLSGGTILFNALHIDGPTPTEPVILETPPSVFNGRKGAGGILQLMQQYPHMLDPVGGFDIVITKAGSGKEGTSYSVAPFMGACAPVPAEALAKLHDLDEFVRSEMSSANRALTNLAAVTGLLPPPAAVAAAPVIEGSATVIAPSAPAAVPGNPAAVGMPAPAVPFQPAPPGQPVYVPAVPVAAAPVAAAPVVAPPVMAQPAPVASPMAQPQPTPAAQIAAATPMESTGDPELDALLSGIQVNAA